MKKLLTTLFGLFLLAGPAHATPILLGQVFHNYGSAAGQIDPTGSDALSADYVTVSDQSSNRFADLFDFRALGHANVAYFRLTLSYSHNASNLLEWWHVRPGQSDDLQWIDWVGSTKSTQDFIIDSATDTFASAVSSGIFSLWFAEQGPAAQNFRLYDATLSVYGEAARSVPEPTMPALLGLGLLAILWQRRRQS